MISRSNDCLVTSIRDLPNIAMGCVVTISLTFISQITPNLIIIEIIFIATF